MVFVGTCSGIVIPGIRAELVGIEITSTSVGDLLSVVSVFFIFVFEVTQVDCFRSWKTVLLFWFDF